MSYADSRCDECGKYENIENLIECETCSGVYCDECYEEDNHNCFDD